MQKTYHFLSGLPRSGNTLLSAILNQNPEIYSSPISPIPDLMWSINDVAQFTQPVLLNKENQDSVKSLLSSFFDIYYKDINKQTIITREKVWGTPDNLNLIKQYINPKPKIIFTVRDILEILASFISLDIDKLVDASYKANLYVTNYRTRSDFICEHLMLLNGDIDKGLLSLSSAFLPENDGIFHIVEYNDLILSPQETMHGIYKFLELPYYEHDFNHIKKIENDNDEAVGFPKNLHRIKPSLEKSSTDISILSEYIRHKYSNMEFWRKDSLMKIRGKDF